MKRLTINWLDLETAFADRPDEFAYDGQHPNWLDLETGEVFCLTDDLENALNRIEAELGERSEKSEKITEHAVRGTIAFQELPDWLREAVLQAAELRFGDDQRFVAVPYFESHESYQYMEDFIDTVRDASLYERLRQAIAQHKPFARFRAVLSEDRRMERQWRVYEQARQRETIIEWLRGIGVEPANSEQRTFDPPPLPELRKIMFAEVRRFVRFARDIPGVERIALVGSLTTAREFPRDIDLLVTVRADCDLAPLAELGRQLIGHMLAHQAGADVFLADAANNYLGRTCQWKTCAPGIRQSCDALHCGARHYLHDDLTTIRLDRTLISHPPVLLWPTLAATTDVPEDIREQLIEPLTSDRDR